MCIENCTKKKTDKLAMALAGDRNTTRQFIVEDPTCLTQINIEKNMANVKQKLKVVNKTRHRLLALIQSERLRS